VEKGWIDYHLHVGDTPNQLVAGCLEDYVLRREAALDLGAGNLRDSRFLQSQGFTKLVAVDNCEDSRIFLTEGIELHIAPIEKFVPEPDAFDFVFSCNTLFFLSPEQIAVLFQNVFSGLRSGGVFACNVLGQQDDWVVQGRQVSSFTEEGLTGLAQGYEVLGIQQSRTHGRTLDNLGMSVGKYWHQISIAMRKP
jgi:SAM-dependent methyltransferase